MCLASSGECGRPAARGGEEPAVLENSTKFSRSAQLSQERRLQTVDENGPLISQSHWHMCAANTDTHTHTHTHTHTYSAQTPPLSLSVAVSLYTFTEREHKWQPLPPSAHTHAYDDMTSSAQTRSSGEHTKWSRQEETTRGMFGCFFFFLLLLLLLSSQSQWILVQSLQRCLTLTVMSVDRNMNIMPQRSWKQSHIL